MWKSKVLFLLMCSLLLMSCGMNSGSSQASGMTYKDMKSMVLDILKTEDAQVALQESLSQTSGYKASSASMLSAQDQESVKIAVKDVISAPDYDKVLKKLMTDTQFAGEFSKAINENNKALHEELIKDPQYQEGLAEAFQSEDMKKVILEVLKSADYRKELMSLMQESLKNPIFKMEMLKLMQEAVSSELSSSGESGGGESGGGESGGSSSGGESSGGNGQQKKSGGGQ